MKTITYTLASDKGTTAHTQQVSDAYFDHMTRHHTFRDALTSEWKACEEIEADNLKNPRLRNLETVIAAKVRELAIEQLVDGMDGADWEATAAAAI